MTTHKKNPKKSGNQTDKNNNSDKLPVIISLIIAIMLAVGSVVFPVSFHISKLLFFLVVIILGLFLHYLKYINYIILFVYIMIFGALLVFLDSLPLFNTNIDHQKVSTISSIDTTKSEPIIRPPTKTISQNNNTNPTLDASTVNVTSVNQKGGITANKVTVDEFPKPVYSLDFITKNIPNDSLFETKARLTIKSKAIVPRLYIACKTPSVINMKIAPEGDRLMQSLVGYYKTTDGFPAEMIQDAYGSYLISIISSKPDKPVIVYTDSPNIEEQ